MKPDDGWRRSKGGKGGIEARTQEGIQILGALRREANAQHQQSHSTRERGDETETRGGHADWSPELRTESRRPSSSSSSSKTSSKSVSGRSHSAPLLGSSDEVDVDVDNENNTDSEETTMSSPPSSSSGYTADVGECKRERLRRHVHDELHDRRRPKKALTSPEREGEIDLTRGVEAADDDNDDDDDDVIVREERGRRHGRGQGRSGSGGGGGEDNVIDYDDADNGVGRVRGGRGGRGGGGVGIEGEEEEGEFNNDNDGSESFEEMLSSQFDIVRSTTREDVDSLFHAVVIAMGDPNPQDHTIEQLKRYTGIEVRRRLRVLRRLRLRKARRREKRRKQRRKQLALLKFRRGDGDEVGIDEDEEEGGGGAGYAREERGRRRGRTERVVGEEDDDDDNNNNNRNDDGADEQEVEDDDDDKDDSGEDDDEDEEDDEDEPDDDETLKGLDEVGESDVLVAVSAVLRRSVHLFGQESGVGVNDRGRMIPGSMSLRVREKKFPTDPLCLLRCGRPPRYSALIPRPFF